MVVVSTPARKVSWRNRTEVANLLEVLASEQTRISHRLAQLRKAHNLSQEAAAARLGITLRQWQRWESGESQPYARNIAKISETFEIPLGELVGESVPEPTQLDQIEQLIRDQSEQINSLSEQLEMLRVETAARGAAVLRQLEEEQSATPRPRARRRRSAPS